MALGLMNRYGAAAWILLVALLVTALKKYGWTEETGGAIAAGLLLLTIPLSIILTGLFDLLGGIFQWKSTLCAVQSMYHLKMDPRKSWNTKYRRDMIIVGCIFTVLGTALLLAWILGV